MSEHEIDDSTTPPAARTRSAWWGYALGGVLIVAAVVLGAWAVWAGAGGAGGLGGSAAPSASPGTTLSATPTAEPTADATPVATTGATPGATPEGSVPGDAEPSAAPVPPTITGFSAASATASCADDRSATASLSLSWAVTGADEVFLAVDASDASAQPFATVDATADGYTSLMYECVREQQLITLTARNGDGAVSSSITVTRELR